MKKPCHLRNASRYRKSNIDSICCLGDLLPWIFQNWSMHLRGIFKVHFKCIKDGWRCNFLVWLKKLHNFDKNWAAHRISEYITYTDGLRKEIFRCPNSRQYLLRRKKSYKMNFEKQNCTKETLHQVSCWFHPNLVRILG